MNMAQLTERFYSLVAPDIPNEWDVEEVVEQYLQKPDNVCLEIFSHIPSIWPISNSLCYDFLQAAPKTLDIFPISRMSQWVCDILDRYEQDGLRATQRFIRDHLSYSGYQSGQGLISLSEIEGRLLPFIRGIAGRDLLIGSSTTTYTDTDTIFVPQELAIFESRRDNLLLYKLILAFQWGFIRCKSFTVTPSDWKSQDDKPLPELWLSSYFKQFETPLLARDLYFFLETVRIHSFLAKELPGLIRNMDKMRWSQIQIPQDTHPAAIELINLQNRLLAGSLDQTVLPPPISGYFNKLRADGVSVFDSLNAAEAWYLSHHNDRVAEYEGVQPLLFQGDPRLDAIVIVHAARQARISEAFIDSLATHLLSLSREKLQSLVETEKMKQDGSGSIESDITMIMDPEFAGTVDEHMSPLLMLVNNEEAQIPEELAFAAEKVIDEFSHLPARFISSAIGKAGDSMAPGSEQLIVVQEEPLTCESFLYDEWDHRRQGYRKNWCAVGIKELPETRSDFIMNTMAKYHGLMTRLRYQFELLRTTDRFARRQRDGDDIDLDALVDSLADTMAGLPPSDRLFIKLLRDERDISVIFLVDMSNSTVGWVGTTIKESLVLLTEALEMLGDRYGIYGFSGMKRTRCELFHIKHLQEPYGEKVRKRIGAISPREYTRMGPAIRHSTRLLSESESKVRLLITLTDGKPEDYDDYKGEYAIEDTRHALLEAKMAGIHPFCITIDHHAHDYMDHMYGPVNYIFVNDIRKLPMRMVEIYRTLTT